VPSDGKSVRRDRFAVADAFEKRVPGDDVLVFACFYARERKKRSASVSIKQIDAILSTTPTTTRESFLA
jgi:hypothetical protein